MKKYFVFLALCLTILSCEKEQQPVPVDPVDPVEEIPATVDVTFSVANNAAFNSLIFPAVGYSIKSAGKEASSENSGFFDGGSITFKNLVCPCTVTYQFKYYRIEDIAVDNDMEYDMSWSQVASVESFGEGKKVGSSLFSPSHSDKVKGSGLSEYIAVLNAIQPKWTVSFDSAGKMTEKDETEASKGTELGVDVLGEYTKDVKVTVIEDKVSTVEAAVDKMVDMVEEYGVDGIDPLTLALGKTLINSKVESKKNQYKEKYGVSSIDIKIRCVKFVYTSKDQSGKDIDLSSCMLWLSPESEGKLLPTSLNKMLLYCPYTLLRENQCSTATDGGFSNVLLLNDCLIVHPDYQGFGKTAGTPQLYLNHETTSVQMYDAVCAAYKIFTQQFGESLKENWFTVIGGVSQGAGTSVATAKYLEQKSETWVSGKKVVFNGKYGDPSSCTFENVTTTGCLADLWKLKFTSCACGPYSPSQTMMHYYDQGWSCYSAIFPVIVKSMIAGYPEIMKGVREEMFYSDKYLADKEMWDDIFLNKTMSELSIQHLMNQKLADPSVAGAADDRILLSDIFSKEALDINSDITKKLKQCLERNDLTSGWNPVRPLYLTVAPNDQIVPYINSQMMLALNAEKVIRQIESDGNHDAASVRWFLTNVSGTFDTLGNY